eukprot:m.112601 g.112601  ORF g.112601 m.112601 type:complete len:366 (-) comp15981_c0_seq1:458-1555(-)
MGRRLGVAVLLLLLALLATTATALPEETQAVNATQPSSVEAASNHSVGLSTKARHHHAGDHEHASLDPQEAKWREEHERYHKEHEGHELMHAEMMLIMILIVVLAQVALYFWKRNLPGSYNAITLLGMWLVPVYYSVMLVFVRFLVLWTIFSVMTGVLTYFASRNPLPRNTPRRVYTFFFVVYKLSYTIGFIGYACMVLDFLGFGLILPENSTHTLLQIGVLLIFYGLYFGVLGRDFAEICAIKMASSIGYFSEKGIPLKSPNPVICAICSGELAAGQHDVEKTYQLACGHRFHEFCIRGWCIIGKKDTCPFCKEKVDMRSIFQSPWARKDVVYSQLLDALRYLVVWQPVIMLLVQGTIFKLGLK